MNLLIVLTLLQALRATAAPARRRDPCAGAVTVTNIVTVSQGADGGVFLQKSIVSSSVIPSVNVQTATTSAGVVQILPSLSNQQLATTGQIISSLASGKNPLITSSIPSPTKTLVATGPISQYPTVTLSSIMASQNIFQPVATGAPPSDITTRSDHPVSRLGIQPQTLPLQTNKFYANFFLGDQTAPTFTHPYVLQWSKGGGGTSSWGMAVSQLSASQKVFGPDASADPAQYFINPVGIQYMVLSAVELGSSTTLTTDTLTEFSVNVNLLDSPGAEPAITFPLVQGMGFVTGVYNGAIPTIQSAVFFRTVTRSSTSPKTGVTKYNIVLEDGSTWLLYAYSSTNTPLTLTVVNNGLLQATSNFLGSIQIAKNPGTGEAIYDAASGAYAVGATLSANVNGATGTYSISWAKSGLNSSTLAMFALPHHVESFSSTTAAGVTTVQLDTTTKGTATLVTADSWTLVESSLPVSLGLAPWSPTTGSKTTLSSAALAAISNAANNEISQDMSAQSNLDSVYYAGKALAKFAGIVYTVNDLLNNTAMAQVGLNNLKEAYALWASNQQQYPLVYDSAWGGVVSSASYATGDLGLDFGNTIYNDHHFHYGYFIYAAAVIGRIDPSWLADNKDYVNALVRDSANPSTEDPYFPVNRMFDWYHGHSWAHGLTEVFDGKDQESSSEDTMWAYALKMWGQTIGDANMEARGNLQLAVQARSLHNYFLYTSDNTVEPSNFIGNKVSGILFENKIDHTTYFGTNIEYIQGIHMIPLLPSSTLTRTQEFVTEEWNTYFSSGRVDSVAGGWRGILYANLAIIDPVTSFNFFADSNFDASYLDGGASRTWYLAFAAGLGGA